MLPMKGRKTLLYLDNNATTKVAKEVFEAMLPFLLEEFGNPSSKYYSIATTAQAAVEDARTKLAKLLNADTEEIVFTSGASESNNLIVKGVADYYSNKGKHLITSSIEHKSVMESFHYLSQHGFDITFLPVDRFGKVDPALVKESIRPDTILVSIIWGNNEVGTVNDIESISKICSEKGVFFHSDATQIIGKLPVNLKQIPVQFLSLSAHKFHGPKGIGACFIRKNKLGLRTKITPLVHGGSQEQGYRAGTLAVHNIVGLGKAAEIALRDMKDNQARLLSLEAWLHQELENNLKGIRFNGDPRDKIPGVINITIPGMNNELLVDWLARQNIAVSTGSACSVSEPSHVLKAMNIPLEEIRQSIRISFSPEVEQEDLERFCQCLYQALS